MVMNRNSEAEFEMNKAIKHPTASVQEIHRYERRLLTTGKNQKAFEVLKLNASKHTESKFNLNVGLVRIYASIADKKNAIKHEELAIRNIPENQKPNLVYYQNELKKFKKGVSTPFILLI